MFSFGCSTGMNSANHKSHERVAKTAVDRLKFAVTDVSGLEDLQRDFETFRTTLSSELGIRIEFFPVANYTAAAPAMLLGKIDIVFAGPSEYLILKNRAKAIPLVAIQRKQYHSIILVRTDSNIQSLSQLKGKTIAMRKVGSTSGHIAPIKLLMDAGLDPNKDYKIVMLDDKGVLALHQKEVDAWATASDRYKNILDTVGLSANNFRIIGTSPLLPSDLFVVSNQLASDLVEDIKNKMLKNQNKLLSSLLLAKANQKYLGGNFVTVEDSQYNMIREVYQKIGQGEFL